MNGWGNDFVVLDGPISLSEADIVALCDRRFGVGADGVLVVTPGDLIGMDYWNADASPAEMCGNGLRCVARYAYDRSWSTGPEFVVRTPVGLRKVKISDGTVEVELGPAEISGELDVDRARYMTVNVGNPHAVTLVAELDRIDVAAIGAMVESKIRGGSNVEFMTVGASGVRMRVWERGVGETLACGTGMAAAALVAHEQHDLPWPVQVAVPGGEGTIDHRDGTMFLSGPATYSFQGVWHRPPVDQA